MDAKTIIKSAMKQKKVKSGALADLLGMNHQSFYNKLNRGTMSANFLIEIADAMGCDIVIRDRESGEIVSL